MPALCWFSQMGKAMVLLSPRKSAVLSHEAIFLAMDIGCSVVDSCCCLVEMAPKES